jgi:hypothetical protein
MKPAVVFAITFVVGIAASSGAKVAMTKPGSAHVATDSTKAHKDSTQTDTALVASGQATTPPGDSARRPVAPVDSTKPAAAAQPNAVSGTPRSAAPSGSAAAPARAPGPSESVIAAAIAAANAPDTAQQASQKRIAKVFTSMDAKQAAKVLEHMSDNDVEVILGYVGPRPAAAIMAELPPERVALLSKLAMQGKKP